MTTIQGEVVPQTPGFPPGMTVISPKNAAARGMRLVLSALIHAVPAAFPNEQDKLDALNAVDAFTNAFAETKPEVREEDPAPIEDVSLRRPPVAPVAAPAGLAIDYNALAAAIVARQQAIAGASE